MRALQTLAGLGLVTWFAGCNAILGNESEYTLGSAGKGTDLAGGAGDETGGTSGTGGGGGKGGNAGKGGTTNAGRGGSGSSGKAGSTGTGGAGSAGESGGAGEPAQGGNETGGEGGQPACEPSGAEDCFNGRDDDCNELTDCADPACDDSIARCVPVPDGAELGAVDPVGCLGASAQLTLYEGLSGPSTCEGCSCEPATSRCDTGIYAYGPYTCGEFQFDGLLYNVFNDSCSQIPADRNIHFYSVRGLSTCNAVGTALPPPVTHTSEVTFCGSGELGGGCEAGYRCAPAEAPAACVLFSGTGHDCTPDYPNVVQGDWYEGYEDDRGCSQCQCSFGMPECVGANLQVYGDPTCSTNPYSLGAAEGSACPLSFTPQSAKISGTPASNTCPLQVYPSGSFEPTGPRTVCCQ
jgi:hypothetical protein